VQFAIHQLPETPRKVAAPAPAVVAEPVVEPQPAG